MEKATFAAGCFWGIEDAFRKLPGVLATRTGYTGGTKHNPGYIEVLSGKTGHAEAVEITFDPSVVSYSELLAVFWSIHDSTLTARKLISKMWNIHDPSSLENIPASAGSHYRSSIFYHNEQQRLKAVESMEAFQRSLYPEKEIITEIVPASEFYQAEDEHQQYFSKKDNRCQADSCRVNGPT